jgi:long-subunit fatty acid transport protein
MLMIVMAIALTSIALAEIPDTLYSLGISARGEGMGGAVTALCYDATATVYNPAALAVISTQQAMVSLGSQPNVTTLLGGVASNPRSINETDIGNMGFSFAGVVIPFSQIMRGLGSGVLGISYARIGHFEQEAAGVLTSGDPESNANFTRKESKKIDTDLITIACGLPLGSSHKLNLGFGVVFGQQLFDFSSSDILDPNDPTMNSTSNDTATGTGVGAIIGVLAPGPRMTWGASYRSEISLSDHDQFEDFTKEMPARLAVGVAYQLGRFGRPEEGSGSELICAIDVENFFEASVGAEDEREDVTNVHVGAEYTFYKNKMIIPIRVGYRTINAAGSDFFEDQSEYSLGIGFRPSNDQISIDFSMGISGDVINSSILSLSYKF